MLQLLFTCKLNSDLTPAHIRQLQETVWQKCRAKDLGGFLVSRDGSLVGLLEGDDRQVIAVCESLVRKKSVANVIVVREVSVEKRDWTTWNDTVYEAPMDASAPEGGVPALAQIVDIAIEAVRDSISTKG